MSCAGQSGYGDGSGSGDGYWLSVFQSKLSVLNTNMRANILSEPGTIAFWKSDADGIPANGGYSEPAHVGMRQTVKGPLTLCTAHALHGTFAPEKWKGDRLWIVALRGEVQRDDDKLGALEREILAEVEP